MSLILIAWWHVETPPKPPAHQIRLRGPWEYEVVARYGDTPNTDPVDGRLQLPGDWSAALGAEFRGRVRFKRRFGTPTGLVPGDELVVVVEQVDLDGEVRLNGTRLGSVSLRRPLRAAIQDLLQPFRNTLEIDVELPIFAAAAEAKQRHERVGRAGGLIGEVRLEIHTGPQPVHGPRERSRRSVRTP